MAQSSPIRTAYQALLKTARLQPNLSQLALVDQLAQLQYKLLANTTWPRISYPKQHCNGVYIYGGVGTGKSRIADLFASTLPKSVNCKRVHFYEFMVDIHTRLHYARLQDTYTGDPLLGIGRDVYSQFPVLCFDEFQVSDIADAMILKRLFGSFWDCGGIMVSTSNRHPSELYLHGLNRPLFIPFIKDLQHRCKVWKMEGDHDYRMTLGHGKRIQVFYTDSSAFSHALSEMSSGREWESIKLKVVMNRSLTVLALPPTPDMEVERDLACKVPVQATFQELCKASVGSSDYHALCNFAHTVFLSGLMQFHANELDYVRRFITLIDIAYESRTRLICLSNTPLAGLFRGISVPTIPSKPGELEKPAAGSNLAQDPDPSLAVKGEGGSSSSMMSTFLGDVEWSATGLKQASLASGGAGENDVRFAIGRAISRLSEMERLEYGTHD